MVSGADAAPWTAGGVVIAKGVLDEVDRDAVARYAKDEEACGYLRGPASEPFVCDEAVPLENLANKLHALDPETYFRPARTFFAFNEKKFDDAVRSSSASGRPVKVLYHSHLDAGAYFSPTDAAVMSFGQPPAIEGGPHELGPGPQWPLAFLVVSVGKPAEGGEARVLDRRLFVWKDAAFVEAEMSTAG
jgi:proteasome lid subunit RPN8/RPN11